MVSHKNNLTNLPPWLGVVIACGILLIVKIPHLNLPHYWDEAFPYSYAIGYMVENGPSLLSDGAPAMLTTGHPLLYYFLQAVWNTIVGDTLWLQRLFPLLISMGCLWMVYLLGARLYDNRVGAGAALLLVCQSTFLSMAGFQLPETLLTLLLMTSIYFLIASRKWLFVLSSSLMLLVKEPAVVLLFIIFLFHILVMLKGRDLRKRIAVCWMYAIPVGLSLLFYFHQYLVQGWVLFPRHTGFMGFTFSFFVDQFSRYFSHLFIYSGRNGIFFTALLLFIYYLIGNRKKLNFTSIGKNSLFLFTLLIGYLVFSAFNFYSNRYILCVFPLFSLLAAASIHYSLKDISKIVYPIGVVILSAVCFYYSLTKKNPHDHSLGYTDEVRCQYEAIRYCVEQGWQDEKIATSFLMEKNLTSYYPRYVSKGEIFSNVNTSGVEEAKLVLKCTNEKYFYKTGLTESFELLKSFKQGNASCEVYVNNE